MRRKLAVLNLALLALIFGAAWRLRQQWVESKTREQKVFRERVAPATAPRPAAEQPQPVTAADYGEVAQDMLFSKDRNPDVVIEAAPPKPLPPLPVAHGVMNLGGRPVVILSEKPGASHRGYSPGEKVGEFTLVAANNEEIVLEWEGQQLKRKLDELIERSPSPGQTAALAPGPASPASSQPRVVATGNASGPGVALTEESRACQPGDSSPAGTVRDGWRKVVMATPFGQACRWEKVK